MLSFYELINAKKKKPYHDQTTCIGRNDIPQYGWTINDLGEEVLEVKSYVNAQEIINSCYESTCLSSIIDRFLKGDDSGMNAMKARAFYDDISTLPQNMHEVHALMVQQRNEFNELPYEDRAVFNNDFNQYLDSLGNGKFTDWLKSKMSAEDVVEIEKNNVESEVKIDE